MSQPNSFRSNALAGPQAPSTPNNQNPPSYVELQRLGSNNDLAAPAAGLPPRSDPGSEVRTKDGRHSPYTARVLDSPSYPTTNAFPSASPPISYPMQHLAGKQQQRQQLPPGSPTHLHVGSPPKTTMSFQQSNNNNNNFAPNMGGSGLTSPTGGGGGGGGGALPPPRYEEAYGRAAVHTALSGRCAFVPIPLDLPPYREQPLPADGDASSSSLPPPLFLGQLRFETTAAEIRYLLQEMSGVEPLRIEPRGNACWVAQLKCELDNDAVRLLHKKVLFDIPGVWVAETAAEVDALRQYTALQLAQMSRKAHLPRDCLVVEEARAGSTTTPQTGPAQPPPPPPPQTGPAPLSLLQSLNNLPPYNQPPGFVERAYRGQRPLSGNAGGAASPAAGGGAGPGSSSQPGSSQQPPSFSGRPPSLGIRIGSGNFSSNSVGGNATRGAAAAGGVMPPPPPPQQQQYQQPSSRH